MPESPWLDIPHTEPNQEDKAIFDNNATDHADRAMNQVGVINFTSDADYSLTQTDQKRRRRLVFTDTGVVLTTTRSIILLATMHREIAIENQTAQVLVVTYAGSTDTVSIPPGAVKAVQGDGVDVWPSSFADPGDLPNLASPADADSVIVRDDSDNGSLKSVLLSSIGTGGGGGSGAATVPGFRGARVEHSSVQNLTSGAWTLLNWDSQSYEVGGDFHDTVTNNSRLTVPSGFSGYAVLTAQVRLDPAPTSSATGLMIRRNGSDSDLVAVDIRDATSADRDALNIKSAPFAVSGGDYFDVKVLVNQASKSVPASAGNTPVYFSIYLISEGVSAAGWRGARVRLNADENTTTATAVPWDVADLDTSGFWSSGSPTRLTIPTGSGIKKVRLAASFSITSPPADYQITLEKNGALFDGGSGWRSGSVAQGGHTESAVVEVDEGDYFEVVPVFGGGSLNLRSDVVGGTWFAIEVVDPIPAPEAWATYDGNTLDATPLVLLSLPIEDGQSILFHVKGEGRNDANGDTFWQDVMGVVKRVGATTSLSGTTDKRPPASGGDAGMSGCALDILANDTNDTGDVQVTGLAATGITWRIKVMFVIL